MIEDNLELDQIIIALMDRGVVDDFRAHHIAMARAANYMPGTTHYKLLRAVTMYGEAIGNYPPNLDAFIEWVRTSGRIKANDQLILHTMELMRDLESEMGDSLRSKMELKAMVDDLLLKGRNALYQVHWTEAAQFLTVNVNAPSWESGKPNKPTYTEDQKLPVALEYIAKARQLDWGLPSLAPEGKWKESGDHQIANLREGLQSTMDARCWTGLKHIDDAVAIGPKQDIKYVGILGFTNHGKSMLTRSMTYDMAAAGKRILYVAREEDAITTWLQLSWLHAHQRHDLNIPPIGVYKRTPLKITPEQWDDLQILQDDLRSGQTVKGEVKVVTHAKWDDIVAEVNSGLDGKPYDVLVIDYIQHLQATNPKNEKDEIRAIFKSAQALSRDYHGGRGLVVISPLQANKEGMKAADAEEGDEWGVYQSLGAVEMYTDAARDMDLVIGVWNKGPLRDKALLKLSCLKSRGDGLWFPTHHVRVNRRTRRVQDMNGRPIADTDKLPLHLFRNNVAAQTISHDEEQAIISGMEVGGRR
jgi:hypothetical protein